MSNLRILYPDIPAKAATIESSHPWNDLFPLSNLIDGERRTVAQRSATSSADNFTWILLDRGGTDTANYLALMNIGTRASRMWLQGASVSGLQPTKISGCIGWWESSTLVTKDGSNLVTVVGDRSGYGRDLVNDPLDSGTSKPTWVDAPSGINGLPKLSFSGAALGPRLVADNAVAAASGSDKPFSAFIVFRPSSVTGTQTLLELNNQNSGGWARIYLDGTTIKHLRRDDAASSVTNTSTGTVALNTTYVLAVSFAGTTVSAWLDGAQILNASACNVGTLTMHRVVVGATSLASSSSDLFNGDIVEVIVYDSALGSTDRGNVESYLTAKWKTAPVVNTAVSTLVGPQGTDWVTTFSETSAYRYWWVGYQASATTTLRHSKLYLGTAWNPGVECDYEWQRTPVKAPDWRAASGAVHLARRERPRYRATITWSGLTDAECESFAADIGGKRHRSGFVLHAAAEGQILDSRTLLHCEVVEFYRLRTVKPDWNTLTVVCEEMQP